jgi:hypothetical protein
MGGWHGVHGRPGKSMFACLVFLIPVRLAVGAGLGRDGQRLLSVTNCRMPVAVTAFTSDFCGEVLAQLPVRESSGRGLFMATDTIRCKSGIGDKCECKDDEDTARSYGMFPRPEKS